MLGTAIEYFVKGYNFNWTIGENTGYILRSMANPNAFGHPDTYGGTYWVNPADMSNDRGGVHKNCGVSNYWFYLLSNGGSGSNDIGSNYNVSAIGIEKASAVAYRTLTTKLTPQSNFSSARTQSIMSARELYCMGSLEERAVTNAWHAVGVGAAYPSEAIAGGFPTNSCANTEATFSVSNPIAGLTYNWSVTSGLAVVGSATGNTVTVKAVGNGNQYISLNVVTSCGVQKISDKMVNIGIPALTVSTYDDRTPQYNNYTYHSAYAELLPGTSSSDYKWYESVNGQFTKLIGTGPSLHQWPIPPCTSKSYRLEVTTTCGKAYWNGYAYNSNCGYTAYPNPATELLTVERMYGETEQKELIDTKQPEKEITINLYDQNGEVVMSKMSKKVKTSLNTKALKSGLYYLHIIDNEGNISKQQILIRHE